MARQVINIEVKHTKKGLKQLIKKLMLLQMYNVTVGLHRNEGRRKANSRTNNSSSLAKVASILEQGITYTQSKTICIPVEPYISALTKKVEHTVTILKGTLITIPQRLFISLHLIPGALDGIKRFCNRAIQSILSNSKGTKGVKDFWKNLGIEARNKQKSYINDGGSARNSTLTQIIKGFNHPLLDTGMLLNAIKYKVNNEFKKGEKAKLRLKFLEQADEMWRRLK